MRAVTGSPVSSEQISLRRAAAIISNFSKAGPGARPDIAAYLRRACSSFDELVQFHRASRKRPGGDPAEAEGNPRGGLYGGIKKKEMGLGGGVERVENGGFLGNENDWDRKRKKKKMKDAEEKGSLERSEERRKKEEEEKAKANRETEHIGEGVLKLRKKEEEKAKANRETEHIGEGILKLRKKKG